MNKLTLYIGTTITKLILLVVLLELGIDFIFSLVNELRYVGTNDYSLLQAFSYLILTTPERVYLMFPISALIGTLMGLGVLASHSELVVMRAVGMSIGDIILAVLKTAFVLALIAWCFGELVAPEAEQLAQNQKSYALSGGQAMNTKSGTWLKDGNSFVYIRTTMVGGHLEGITRYQFDKDLKLLKSSYAEYADYKNKEWVLSHIRQTSFVEGKPKVESISQEIWHSAVNPEMLGVVGVKALEKLTMNGLLQTISYRENNGLDSARYKLAFWEKVFQPFAVLIMMFLAIPFVFGPLRETSLGLKMLSGIMFGFIFYILNKLIGPMAVVFHWPAILGAIIPSFLFFLLGLWLLRRTV